MLRNEKGQLKKLRQTPYLIDQRLSWVGNSVAKMIDHFKLLFNSNKSSYISFRSMNKHSAGMFERLEAELNTMVSVSANKEWYQFQDNVTFSIPGS